MAVNQRLRPGHGSEGNLTLIFIGLKRMGGPPRKEVLGWRALLENHAKENGGIERLVCGDR